MSYSEKSPVRVVDNVLRETLFDALQGYAHAASYDGVVSDHDGVTYPDICAIVPRWIAVAMQNAIAKSMGLEYKQVRIDTQFFRLTTKNTPPAPHGAHNDAIHGTHSAFYYINDKPPGVVAGTSLVTHKETGLSAQPVDRKQLEVWRRDTNFYNAWHIDELIEWRANRLAIYPADRMHRAEGVWGAGPCDGRLVLITFFSC